MRAHRQIAGSLAALIAMHAAAQMPYPELTIQDAAWTDGTHQYAVSNRILSPGAPHLPVDISGTADAEFVSAASVRLRPGFHAGGFAVNQGRFRARIDEGLGQPADLVIISPAPDGSSPYGSIEDNVVHVHKWEKVELGLRLPAIYQAAIDSFFHHYYPHPNDPYLSAPGNTDPVHDLNPYADDSLQLVMTLTRPDGSSTMRWGFFTREATWDSTVSDPDMAWLIEGTGSPLQPYAVRFRFAPDQEGAWSFRISAKAPLTSDAQGATLPELLHTGFGLQCMPPLADNNGYLQVNAANRRHLQFQGDPALQGDETPFFGLGTNMANINHGSFGAGVVPPGVTYIKRDHRNFQETMERLHAVGGNYLRMYLLEKIFSPEYVNLGVYDQYRSQPACANGNAPSFRGNCQYQCWAFDQMIDCARANNIYLQVCVDAYPPGINFESLGWGANAYWLAFIEPNPLPPPQRFNMRKFFYTYGEGHPDRYTKGVFYYWKRKYKYMMSRWGWSVNIAALEPFNEIDQLLTYRTDTIDGNCNENDGAWAADAQLPDTISAWFGDMARFVRGTQDPEHPARSPLGENKLFLASYAMNDPGMPAAESFYAPLTNPEVDLIDAHLGLYPDLQAERDLTDERIHQGFRNATAFWNRFPAAQSDWHGAAIPMPFIIGETSFSAEDSNDDNFDDPFNHHLVDDPAHDYPPWRDGPESQQSAYASQTMTATRAYLGSGYSWWGFQNGRAANLTPPSPPTPSNIQHWQGVYRANFYGALKYGDENANPPIPWEDKLVAGTFSTYSLASAPSSLPTPPADYHRGKFNGSLSSGTVLGTVNLIDQDGQAITHAVGWTKLIYSDASNDPVHEIVTNQISNDQGLLNIHRGPVINGWYVSKYEMRVHVPGGATSPGDASNQSYQSWQQLGSSLTLARSKLAFTAEASGVTVPIGQSYDPKAWSTLFVNNVTYEGNGSQGASGDLRARQFIHMSTEFHAAHGSEVHIHPENVFPDCGDPHMLVAEDNPHINHESAKRATDSAHQLVLRFKDFPACGLRVAPNPCGEFLEVSGLPPGAPYRIVSDQGAIVLTGIITVQPIRIQVSAISPGHYTLHAEFENTTCSAPFVKMN